MVCFYFISQSTGNYVVVLTLYMEELWNKIYFRCVMPLSHLNVFLFVFVVLVLFQFYSRPTRSSQSHFQEIHCQGILDFQISSDFRAMILCTFMMPFLYDLDFIFLCLNFKARYRRKMILLLQISNCSLYECKVYQWSWSD